MTKWIPDKDDTGLYGMAVRQQEEQREVDRLRDENERLRTQNQRLQAFWEWSSETDRLLFEGDQTGSPMRYSLVVEPQIGALRSENERLRGLLARWYRCYQQEGSPLLHSETRDALGDVT